MYKDELIQMHQFLVYILKYLEATHEIDNSFSEYNSLNISPHHIHRTKIEHKHAIFILSNSILEVIMKENKEFVPLNVSTDLIKLINRYERK
jgi:hypothetical protein